MRAAHSHATVGKTSLLISYVDGRLPDYTPTLFEHGECAVDLDGQRVALSCKDTARREYDRWRPTSDEEADVFLVCFSVVDPYSLDNVLSRVRRGDVVAAMHSHSRASPLQRYPEVSHYCPGAKLVLVGTKCGLRKNPQAIARCAEQGTGPCTRKQAMQVAKDIRAVQYLECQSWRRLSTECWRVARPWWRCWV